MGSTTGFRAGETEHPQHAQAGATAAEGEALRLAESTRLGRDEAESPVRDPLTATAGVSVPNQRDAFKAQPGPFENGHRAQGRATPAEGQPNARDGCDGA